MSVATLLLLATLASPKNYTIDVSQTTKEVKPGSSGMLHLVIKPTEGFKVSPEAPLRINLASEGLKLHKTKLGHDDAKDKKSTSPEFGVKFATEKEAGDEAIEVVRAMNGATDGRKAGPGTIRGDFSLSNRENLVHASDATESAAREIALWFPNL